MDSARSLPRRLRLFLRDFRMVEAQVSIAEQQSLASYFAHRKSYLNLLAAEWTSSGETVNHAALRVEQVLWAAGQDGEAIPLVTSSGKQEPRQIEIQLDGGLVLRGGLSIGERQRLSDYLESAGRFIPLHGALLLRSGRPPKEVNVDLGDVVVNQEAIQAVWETASQEPLATVAAGMPAEEDAAEAATEE